MRSISNHWVAGATSILETIRVIGDGSLQLALVCRDGKLLGTATDGDIRRAILAAVPLRHADLRDYGFDRRSLRRSGCRTSRR